MTQGADVIVAFRSPPVTEVVAAVAFESSAPEDVLESLLSAFWAERLRSDFPSLQRQPAYSPPVERFGAGGPSQDLRVRFTLGAPPTRLWAMTDGGKELLQLQPGWFACNWRKVQPQTQYDRWPQRRASFEKCFADMQAFLAERGVADLRPYQCEVTYINQIRAGASWKSHADVGAIFAAATNRRLAVELPLERVSGQLDFLFNGPDGSTGPAGRLHVTLNPGFADGGDDPIYVLDLTARGAPLSQDQAGVLDFLDLGRATIDRAFLALTSEALHTEWGLIK